MIATPSPPGRWKPFFCERAHTRKTTATATSRIAASTNVNAPSADTLPWTTCLVYEQRLLVPGQDEREHQRDRRARRRAAAPSAAGTVPRARSWIGMSSTSRLAAPAGQAGRSSSRGRRADAISSSRSASASWRASSGGSVPLAASSSANRAREVRDGGAPAAPGSPSRSAARRRRRRARPPRRARGPRARAARRPRRPRGRAQPCSNPTVSEPSSSVALVGL